MKRYQFVWWRIFRIAFHRFDNINMGKIYEWAIYIGFLEIRKWRNKD